MIQEDYPDEITKARWAMDAAENEVERTCLREKWLRLRERERQKLPLRVRELKERGCYSLQELIDAYGGVDAFLGFTAGRVA